MKIIVSYTVDLQLRHAVLTPDAIEFYADNCKYLEMPSLRISKFTGQGFRCNHIRQACSAELYRNQLVRA